MEGSRVSFHLGAAAAVLFVAATAGLLAWIGIGALTAPPAGAESAEAPGRLAAPASPSGAQVPDPVEDVAAPEKPVEPVKLNLKTPGEDILLKYDECPAKCLVDLLEDARPKAAIGVWCRAEAPDAYVCVSVIDEPSAGVYECRAWLVATDKRAGVELLRTGPTGCPSRPMTPPAGAVAR